jgi:RNA polymerase sigma-70 factor (ECF subfamily)
MDAGARHERLYREHADAVYRYALRRDPATAEDVVAEVFLVAWRRLADVPSDAELPWLLGVARRAHANQRRSSRRQRAVRDRLARQPAPDAEDHARLIQTDAAIHQALACVPPRDREVLMLVAWDGLDHAGAARVMGCSTANVAVRLHRARRRLARELARIEGAPRAVSSLVKESPDAG